MKPFWLVRYIPVISVNILLLTWQRSSSSCESSSSDSEEEKKKKKKKDKKKKKKKVDSTLKRNCPFYGSSSFFLHFDRDHNDIKILSNIDCYLPIFAHYHGFCVCRIRPLHRMGRALTVKIKRRKRRKTRRKRRRKTRRRRKRSMKIGTERRFYGF